MRGLIVEEVTTLDGVVQAPGGAGEDTEGGVRYGGSTQPYWHDDIGVHFFQTMSQAHALLLGWKTWQIHGAAFEPAEGDPFADALKGRVGKRSRIAARRSVAQQAERVGPRAS